MHLEDRYLIGNPFNFSLGRCHKPHCWLSTKCWPLSHSRRTEESTIDADSDGISVFHYNHIFDSVTVMGSPDLMIFSKLFPVWKPFMSYNTFVFSLLDDCFVSLSTWANYLNECYNLLGIICIFYCMFIWVERHSSEYLWVYYDGGLSFSDIKIFSLGRTLVSFLFETCVCSHCSHSAVCSVYTVYPPRLYLLPSSGNRLSGKILILYLFVW